MNGSATASVLACIVGSAVFEPGLVAQTAARVPGPFPAQAAGWGPPAGGGLQYARWAEDWSAAREQGAAPPGKAMPLGGDTSLTLSGESRLRANHYTNARLVDGDEYTEGLWRGVLGADLHFGDHVRFYGELAHGDVAGGPDDPAPNIANDVAANQAFVDVRSDLGGSLVGAMVGRQEFADGPRQLLGLGDGANLHRTWNGVRGYLHGENARVGVFALWATRFGSGGFDEHIDGDERLYGASGSIVLARGDRGATTFMEPFWLSSRVPDVRLHDEVRDDRRDTPGVRLWGKDGRVGFDTTVAYQVGRRGDRGVDAWGVFAIHDVLLTEGSCRPQATLRVDVATGGGSGGGAVHTFHPLYTSSSYLGEGRLLSLSNLLLVSPGFAIAPTADTKLSIEYGFAWRFANDDAVYGGGLRAYPGTAAARGDEIGRMLRVEGRWNAPKNVVFAFGYERLETGDVLDRAGLPAADYAFVSVTVRY
ncbi:MAG: alginate export family protein [Planctomycetes bacterium]|nr:alginate export family protein [Planctomycetota bacterium]